jgi:hypothetical protein
MSSLLRWKGQALQFYRYITGPQSKAARQGLLPVYAHLAFVIATSAGALAGMAKKAWRDDDPKAMPLDRIRSLRVRINRAFDQLEAVAAQKRSDPVSAILPENATQAASNYERHGNFALLALSTMEEAAELAVPLMRVAEGARTLREAKPEIDFESADLRVNLHIVSENAGVCAETTTSAKWALVRERFPAEAFDVVKRPQDAEASTAAAPALSSKKKASS